MVAALPADVPPPLGRRFDCRILIAIDVDIDQHDMFAQRIQRQLHLPIGGLNVSGKKGCIQFERWRR